jgi:hypothetical protein
LTIEIVEGFIFFGFVRFGFASLRGMGTRIVRIMRIEADLFVALRPLFDYFLIKTASGGRIQEASV